MKEIYIITDLHLSKTSHKNMLIKELLRPENYTDLILNNLRQLTPNDVLICLGDICFGDELYWHDELRKVNCHSKIMIKGNHDKRTYNWYLDNGWDIICENMLVNYFGYKVLLSHKPTADSGYFDLNICGHFHNNTKEHWEPELVSLMNHKHHVLVLENIGYRPVKLETIIKVWRKWQNT